jgi:hypothetical protein
LPARKITPENPSLAAPPPRYNGQVGLEHAIFAISAVFALWWHWRQRWPNSGNGGPFVFGFATVPVDDPPTPRDPDPRTRCTMINPRLQSFSLLTLLLALTLCHGWTAAVTAASKAEVAEQALKARGAVVENGEDEGKPYCMVSIPKDWTGNDADLAQLAALEHVTSVITQGAGIGNAGLKHLRGLAELELVSIYGPTKVTDAGLEHLTKLPALKWLILDGLPVSDDGLKTLSAAKSLTLLSVSRTKVTDRGLKHLRALDNLTAIRLSDDSITDEGLQELAVLKKLTIIAAWDTKVTQAGVARLKAALPNCEVHWQLDQLKDVSPEDSPK